VKSVIEDIEGIEYIKRWEVWSGGGGGLVLIFIFFGDILKSSYEGK